MQPSTSVDFDVLVRENQRVIYQIAYSVLSNAADAEDVTQDAFLRAHAKLAELRDPNRVRAWLCRITRNLALNRRRDDARRAQRDDRANAACVRDHGLEAIAIERDFEAHVRREIDGLPAHLREVLLLCAIDGLEPSSVAHMLAIPAGTVRSRLHEARRRLLTRVMR